MDSPVPEAEFERYIAETKDRKKELISASVFNLENWTRQPQPERLRAFFLMGCSPPDSSASSPPIWG